MNSMILSGIIWILSKLKQACVKLYQTSFLCNLFDRFAGWFDKSYQNSFFVKCLGTPADSDGSYGAGFGKISVWIRQGVRRLFLPIILSARHSRFVHVADRFLFYIPQISLRCYGLSIVIIGVAGLLRAFLLQEFSLSLYASLFCVLLGAGSLLFPQNLSHLLANSFVLKAFGYHEPEEPLVCSYKHALIIGICLSALVLLLGIVPFAICIVVVFAAIFTFRFTQGVLIAYITLLPFLPTMLLVAGALCLLMVFVIKSYVRPFSGGTVHVSMSLFMLLMGGMLVFGVFNSHARMSSLKSVMVYLAFMLVYYLIINLITSKNMLARVLEWMVYASIICSLYGIYQYFMPGELDIWQDAQMFEDIKGRIVSFFENPNVYGEYLILMIMLNIAMILQTTSLAKKMWGVFALVLSCVCMVLTYSRGCWIGIVVAVALFLLLAYRKWFLRAIVIGGASLFFLPQSVMTRLLSIGNLADSSTSYRVYIWEGTLSMLKDYWITGIGVGTDAFNSIYPIYAYGAITAPHPHNLYLLLVSEMGILGLIVFLLLMLVLFKKLFVESCCASDKDLRICASAFLAALFGFLVQGMFDNVWYNYRVFLLFFILVGLCTTCCVLAKGGKSAE